MTINKVGDIIIISLYVDDLIITGYNERSLGIMKDVIGGLKADLVSHLICLILVSCMTPQGLARTQFYPYVPSKVCMGNLHVTLCKPSLNPKETGAKLSTIDTRNLVQTACWQQPCISDHHNAQSEFIGVTSRFMDQRKINLLKGGKEDPSVCQS